MFKKIDSLFKWSEKGYIEMITKFSKSIKKANIFILIILLITLNILTIGFLGLLLLMGVNKTVEKIVDLIKTAWDKSGIVPFMKNKWNDARV